MKFGNFLGFGLGKNGKKGNLRLKYLGKFLVLGQGSDNLRVAVFMWLLVIIKMTKPCKIMSIFYESIVSTVLFVIPLSKAAS